MLLMRRVLLLSVVLPSLAVAQKERIRIRSLPLPDVTVRMSVDQTLHVDVQSAALPAPMALDGTTLMRFSQRAGQPDTAGMISTQLTYDTLQIAMNLNGSPMGPSGSDLAGKSVTAKYDSAGRLMDLVLPPELERLATPMRNIFSSSLGALPSGELAIGDSVTTSMSVPIPIDLPGASNSASVAWVTRFRLDRVLHEGAGVIAVFDILSQGTLKQMLATALGNADVDLKMTGTGTMEVDVQRGLVRTGTTDTKLNMTMDLGGGSTVTMTGNTRTVTKGAVAP
jgi:hypothetical protein